MPLILGTNSIKDTGYDVANSLRFNDDDDARLSKTLGTPTNRDKYTLSVWVKRSTLGANSSIFTCYGNASNQKGTIRFDSTDKISAYLLYDGGWHYVQTSAVFRDVSAWYNIILAVDTTQATDTNRVKLYVNGSLATIGAATYPSQNEDTWFNAATEHQIGSLIDETEDFDGYMAEFVFIDGQQLDESSFGEFDSDTNIWKPIDVSGLTFGNNGFYLDFENSGSLGADVSGNGNNFTVNNLTSIDQTTDTCTNNFATANPNDVMKQSSGILKPDFANGNLSISRTGDSAVNVQTFGTIAVETGKWFWEIKGTVGTGTFGYRVGVFFGDDKVHSGTYYYGANAFYIHQNGLIYYNNSSTTYMSSLSQGDIVNVALDRTNGEIYLGKNGQWSDGAGNNNQTFSNAVGIASTLSVSMPNKITYPFFDVYDQINTTVQMDINFGNPPYSESGGNSDANGYGNFSISVPSGYYALNTKNLAEYG